MIEVRERSIRVRFTWQGRRRTPTLVTNGAPMAPTPSNIRYAERLAAEIAEKIRRDTFVWSDYFGSENTGEQPTLSQQFKVWLAAQRIEHSTRAGYSSAIKFWSESMVDGLALGERQLRTLRHSDLLRALAARQTLSGKTINNYVSVLREALELARSDGLVAENVACQIPRAKHQKEQPDPFTGAEVERIIADMHSRAPAQVANMVEFWAWTGLRTSEIAGLRWPAIDLASGRMLVNEALVRGKEKARTKTATARTVILNSRALAALERQRQHTFLADQHVFIDPRYGTPWREERAFRRSFWEPCLKRLGIRYRRPYQLRHTYATAMLMAGMRPAFCARQLGHSVQMLLSTYARWVDGDRDQAEMERLEASMRPHVSEHQNENG